MVRAASRMSGPAAPILRRRRRVGRRARQRAKLRQRVLARGDHERHAGGGDRQHLVPPVLLARRDPLEPLEPRRPPRPRRRGILGTTRRLRRLDHGIGARRGEVAPRRARPGVGAQRRQPGRLLRRRGLRQRRRIGGDRARRGEQQLGQQPRVPRQLVRIASRCRQRLHPEHRPAQHLLQQRQQHAARTVQAERRHRRADRLHERVEQQPVAPQHRALPLRRQQGQVEQHRPVRVASAQHGLVERQHQRVEPCGGRCRLGRVIGGTHKLGEPQHVIDQDVAQQVLAIAVVVADAAIGQLCDHADRGQPHRRDAALCEQPCRDLPDRLLLHQRRRRRVGAVGVAALVFLRRVEAGQG